MRDDKISKGLVKTSFSLWLHTSLISEHPLDGVVEHKLEALWSPRSRKGAKISCDRIEGLRELWQVIPPNVEKRALFREMVLVILWEKLKSQWPEKIDPDQVYVNYLSRDGLWQMTWDKLVAEEVLR